MSTTSSPLAGLVASSISHEDAGAPVATDTLTYAAGASALLLACGLVGVFVAPGDASVWVGGSIVNESLTVAHAVGPLAGTLALAGLSLDAALAAGPPVGIWARVCCAVQVLAGGLACLPLTLALVIVVANFLVAAALVIALIGVLIAAMAGG